MVVPTITSGYHRQSFISYSLSLLSPAKGLTLREVKVEVAMKDMNEKVERRPKVYRMGSPRPDGSGASSSAQGSRRAVEGLLSAGGVTL